MACREIHVKRLEHFVDKRYINALFNLILKEQDKALTWRLGRSDRCHFLHDAGHGFSVGVWGSRLTLDGRERMEMDGELRAVFNGLVMKNGLKAT